MHEYSLVQALMERVGAEVSRRGATKVTKVSVRIGDLAGVERDLFATAFATFTQRSFAEGAELEIIPVPAEWRCRRCDRPIPKIEVLRCCDTPAVLASGGDLVLEQIHLEVPEHVR